MEASGADEGPSAAQRGDLFSLVPNTAPHLHCSLRHEFLSPPSGAPPPPFSNFLKGVRWSPDGLSFLTAADDNWLRVYDTPPDVLEAAGLLGPSDAAEARRAAAAAGAPPPAEPPPALRVHGGEAVHDFAWYSRASAADPASFCFAAAARGRPVQLHDALTGELRASYRSYDAADEPAAAVSLGFSRDGAALAAGHAAAIHLFAVDRPGRDYVALPTRARGRPGQPGLVSCFDFHPDAGSAVFAAGAYSGVAALYDARTAEALLLLEGHAGGVTHVRFSADGNFLYSGARRDAAIHCWDVRHASGAVYTLARATATTNQRVAFDIEPAGRHLATGGEGGRVALFDLRDGAPAGGFAAADDTVAGAAFHPLAPVLATASGHRRYPLEPRDGSGSSGEEDERAAAPLLTEASNALRVWRFAAVPLEEDEAGEGGSLMPT